ncbi:hypothetical protein CCH79_00012065 [Gambusia affinis]|uniref:C2H2-type domain-containing protein n=1 Tax=Gambusia affinis TaxID=33528 RepID=A0A315WSB2_GAMAF|nr:hypothetical protein CCH79_00012065 [Gambusia affinis]
MLLTVHLALAKWSGTLDRKFECELCDRSFSEKWALNNHMKLHNGEKPYKCIWPSCHYAFLNLSAMKDHYRTHTGETHRHPILSGRADSQRPRRFSAAAPPHLPSLGWKEHSQVRANNSRRSSICSRYEHPGEVEPALGSQSDG